MNQTINRHRNNLACRQRHAARLKEELDRKKAEYERNIGEIEVLRSQIERAEKENKGSFDDDRFNIKRKAL
jgi:hypothetical protein